MVEGFRVRLVMLAASVALAGLAGGGCGLESGQPSTQDEPAMQEVSSAQGTGAEPGASDEAAMTGVTRDEGSDFMRRLRSGEYRTVRLVGDSITAGYGTNGFWDPDATAEGVVIYDDGMGNVHHEPSAAIECWANAFRAWAADNGMQGFVNAGISGWFMHDLAANPTAWLGEGADVSVVALGTNDAGYYGPGQFAEDARAALSAAQQMSKLVVVLAPVADLRPQELLVEPATELGDILQGICAEDGYVFVDTRQAVTPEMFCDDGLHPTSEGSLAIWDCLRTTLALE